MTTNYIKSELKSLLENILKLKINENEITIVGKSEKGDNYTGDIIYVNISGDLNKSFVLKCASKLENVREFIPVKQIYKNEMYVYNTVMPSFYNFQVKKGIKRPFDNVPKCYGTINLEMEEMIVMENLNDGGYKMHDRVKAMDQAHLKLILAAYARWHALSMAFYEQKPGIFKSLTANLENTFETFTKEENSIDMFVKSVKQGGDWLKGHISDCSFKKLQSYIQEIPLIIANLGKRPPFKPYYVIMHGDAWNNNYLFKYDNDVPVDVKIVDWQNSRYISPFYDIALCLFTSTSKEHVDEFDVLLKFYYDNLSKELEVLGSKVENIFPYSVFVEEWALTGRIVITIAFMMIKACVASKEEVFSTNEDADNKENPLDQLLSSDLKNKTAYVERMGPLVEYLAKNNIL